MLYCQLSALPVLAWSRMSAAPLPPLSVYQRRTPGRSAYPANPGLDVCAADATNKNNDPASGCRPKNAAATTPITIRWIPFIGLLHKLRAAGVAPTGVSRRSIVKPVQRLKAANLESRPAVPYALGRRYRIGPRHVNLKATQMETRERSTISSMPASRREIFLFAL